MTNRFTYRAKTEFERYVDAYEGFVENVQSGYEMCLDEYVGDLLCRGILEEGKHRSDVARMWSRVERSDDRLRSLLLPTTKCIHGDHPREWFWLWGYPPKSPNVEEDLRRRALL